MGLQSEIRVMAGKIADDLIMELRRRASEEVLGPVGAVEELVGQVAKEMTSQLPVLSATEDTADHGTKERLSKLESRLARLVEKIDRPAQGQEAVNLPNLKYAKSKYQNVDSLLNYIETKESEGGIKLVIMNFND